MQLKQVNKGSREKKASSFTHITAYNLNNLVDYYILISTRN